MDIRSKKLKTRNLPEPREAIDQINAKPYVFIALFLFIGLYMFFMTSYLWGVFMIAIFLYYLVFVKNKILTEFYEDYIVFYNDKDEEECYIVFYNEIKSWSYEVGRFATDTVQITFKDGKRIAFDCLSKRKMKRYLNEHVGEMTKKKSTAVK